jgi:hypothetical protein
MQGIRRLIVIHLGERTLRTSLAGTRWTLHLGLWERCVLQLGFWDEAKGLMGQMQANLDFFGNQEAKDRSRKVSGDLQSDDI